MRGSKLTTRGNEILIVYPEKRITNNKGASQVVPDKEHPLKPIRVTCTTDRQMKAEVPGQLQVKKLTLLMPYSPHIGGYAQFLFRGEEWDCDIPPTHSNVSKTTQHTELFIRSRNRAANPWPPQT